MMKIEAMPGSSTATKVLLRCADEIITTSGTISAANGIDSSSSRKAKSRTRKRERNISKPYPASEETARVRTVPSPAMKNEFQKIRGTSTVAKKLAILAMRLAPTVDLPVTISADLLVDPTIIQKNGNT